MAIVKDPAVLFFIDNWLVSTAEMDSETRGWYLNLTLHHYDKKSLPNNIDELANLAGVKFKEYDKFVIAYQNEISKKFVINPDNGRLINPKADKIIKGREAFKEKRTKAGNIGVIIKMAKKVAGYAKFAENLKNDLYSLEDDQLEKLKDMNYLMQLINAYKGVPAEREKFDLSFVAPEFLPVFEKWLTYKKERKQTYTSLIGLKTCYKNLIEYGANDVVVAEFIVDKAIGNFHAGFFAPTKNELAKLKPETASNTPAVSKAEGLVSQHERVSLMFKDNEE